jgi:hypothetical protein
MSSKKKPVRKTKSEEQAVLVTTEHRGVFFGYCNDVSAEVLSLRKGRMCVYWSKDMKGVMGLAVTGPSATCRIGPAADIKLKAITSVTSCTPEAVAAWEKAPWQS